MDIFPKDILSKLDVNTPPGIARGGIVIVLIFKESVCYFHYCAYEDWQFAGVINNGIDEGPVKDNDFGFNIGFISHLNLGYRSGLGAQLIHLDKGFMEHFPDIDVASGGPAQFSEIRLGR